LALLRSAAPSSWPLIPSDATSSDSEGFSALGSVDSVPAAFFFLLSLAGCSPGLARSRFRVGWLHLQMDELMDR
jgi:hypothetical protein